MSGLFKATQKMSEKWRMGNRCCTVHAITWQWLLTNTSIFNRSWKTKYLEALLPKPWYLFMGNNLREGSKRAEERLFRTSPKLHGDFQSPCCTTGELAVRVMDGAAGEEGTLLCWLRNPCAAVSQGQHTKRLAFPGGKGEQHMAQTWRNVLQHHETKCPYYSQRGISPRSRDSRHPQLEETRGLEGFSVLTHHVTPRPACACWGALEHNPAGCRFSTDSPHRFGQFTSSSFLTSHTGKTPSTGAHSAYWLQQKSGGGR